MRAGSGGLNGEVCFDIADVVRDDIADVVRDAPTILRKKMEELRVLGASFEHDACIRTPGVSFGRTKINEIASA